MLVPVVTVMILQPSNEYIVVNGDKSSNIGTAWIAIRTNEQWYTTGSIE
jgi:hypothetical protein